MFASVLSNIKFILPVRLIRLWLWRMLVATAAVLVCAAVIEGVLEYRDVQRLMPGQTFAEVGSARIRYKLVSPEKSGAVVVILSGVSASIEQADLLQNALAPDVTSLAYDRAGYGFSEGAAAYTAEDQGAELAGLLRALGLDRPVVLVGYSTSAALARIFAARFPERTAGVYLVDPCTDHLKEQVPGLHSYRRRYARSMLSSVIGSTFGYTRFVRYLRDGNRPMTEFEQRAAAVVVRRPHYWALAREWYGMPVSQQQAQLIGLPTPGPIEVAYVKPEPGDAAAPLQAKYYSELISQSRSGTLFEIEDAQHEQLLGASAVLDHVLARVKRFAQLEHQR
jgi:pimeloyl-ACP methyl ester carboxylesterase